MLLDEKGGNRTVAENSIHTKILMKFILHHSVVKSVCSCNMQLDEKGGSNIAENSIHTRFG